MLTPPYPFLRPRAHGWHTGHHARLVESCLPYSPRGRTGRIAGSAKRDAVG